MLSQLSNFTGYYRKTSPMLSGARSFDRCIQSQQIRLVGNLGDPLQNIGHRFTFLVERLHLQRGCHNYFV
ncbi:hypothetical protein D3C81_2209840 [compost metagenome]